MSQPEKPQQRPATLAVHAGQVTDPAPHSRAVAMYQPTS